MVWGKKTNTDTHIGWAHSARGSPQLVFVGSGYESEINLGYKSVWVENFFTSGALTQNLRSNFWYDIFPGSGGQNTPWGGEKEGSLNIQTIPHLVLFEVLISNPRVYFGIWYFPSVCVGKGVSARVCGQNTPGRGRGIKWWGFFLFRFPWRTQFALNFEPFQNDPSITQLGRERF